MNKKRSKPFKPTRSEILRATRADMRPPKGVPQDVIDEVQRRQDDYIVGWVQGLAAHIEEIDATKSRSVQQSRPKPAKVTDERRPEEREKALMQPVISIEPLFLKQSRKPFPSERAKPRGKRTPRNSGREANRQTIVRSGGTPRVSKEVPRRRRSNHDEQILERPPASDVGSARPK